MLTKTENKIMNYLFEVCKDKTSVLISPADLLAIVKEERFTLIDLENTVKDLSLDGYFDLIYSDRRGEPVYCITLLEKGKGFSRSKKVMRRNLAFRLGLTVSLAFLSFIIGLILKAIF